MQCTKRQCWHQNTHSRARTDTHTDTHTSSEQEKRQHVASARAGMHFISFHIFFLLFLRFGFLNDFAQYRATKNSKCGFFSGGFFAFFMWFLFCGCVLFQNEFELLRKCENEKMRKCGNVENVEESLEKL